MKPVDRMMAALNALKVIETNFSVVFEGYTLRVIDRAMPMEKTPVTPPAGPVIRMPVQQAGQLPLLPKKQRKQPKKYTKKCFPHNTERVPINLEVFHAALLAKSISKGKLARWLGIGASSVSGWGVTRDPVIDLFDKACDFLDCQPKKLVGTVHAGGKLAGQPYTGTYARKVEA